MAGEEDALTNDMVFKIDAQSRPWINFDQMMRTFSVLASYQLLHLVLASHSCICAYIYTFILKVGLKVIRPWELQCQCKKSEIYQPNISRIFLRISDVSSFSSFSIFVHYIVDC